MLGGTASGKSEYAESLVLKAALPRYYLATMQVLDIALLEDLGNLAANELYDPNGAGAQTTSAILHDLDKAVGNTPTAPLAIVEEPEPGLRPAPVIGVPVGFVNVVESKERLLTACEACGVPAIVAMGRKSGSNVATAICNTLVYSAVERLDSAARGRK